MKHLIHYILEHYGEELTNSLVKIEKNGAVNCIFYRKDTDVFLSQITFWDNFAYTAEILTISDEKYLLNENEILNNQAEQCIKFQRFMEVIERLKD